MADSTLTVTLLNGSSVTLTLSSTSWPDAQQAAQQITLNKGFFADSGDYIPSSAILKVHIS